MKIRVRWLFYLLLGGLSSAYAGNQWSTVSSPLSGSPEVIGSFSAGCVVGAVALPLLGEGYQVMRSSRNRYYGHPTLVQFVKQLGQQAASLDTRLLIGDLGQPRGGPMPSGHRSHQSGLDVDVWFLQQPRHRQLSPSDTEQLEMLTMVRPAEGTLNARHWSPRYRDMLKAAALSPAVDRIFVNAIIKQALCESETDRSWLSKVRPWWGHDAHFHVRLACPADSAQCKPQKPLPPGDGCDGDLANWVRDIVEATVSPKRARKPEPPAADRMPAACDAVLYNTMALER